jgi:hypothetical protein
MTLTIEKMNLNRKYQLPQTSKTLSNTYLIAISLLFCNLLLAQKIKLTHLPESQKVDITIDDDFFTSYRYPDDMEKAVLYPVKATSGHLVTRGFPLDPRPRERVDHPHHVGIWFNYGDVNGLDFWNNSYAIAEDQKHRYGKIVHVKVVGLESGEKGKLMVESLWKTNEGKTLMQEYTTLIFSSENDTRIIDRVTKLEAIEDIHFEDSKEGMYAIRVAKELELPDSEPVLYIGQDGKTMADKTLDNTGVSGTYLSSEGLEGNDVWGTRGAWTILKGNIDGDSTAISIIDHPDNIGYPTYWMARGYGLYAANPLGQKVYSNGELELNFKLNKGEEVVFKYRMLIHSGSELKEDAVEKHAKRFEKAY